MCLPLGQNVPGIDLVTRDAAGTIVDHRWDPGGIAAQAGRSVGLLVSAERARVIYGAVAARYRAEQEELERSPLHQELMRMHLEVRAGRPREEALRSLGDRCGIQEVRSMVSAFIQSDRLGTPLGKTLRVHAESARVQRRHRAEERASLAPLKMIFPTVLFLMPAFFLVAMAPSLLGLIKSFRSLIR